MVGAIRYKSPRPYIDYHQLMNWLDVSGFNVSKVIPLRWRASIEKIINVGEDPSLPGQDLIQWRKEVSRNIIQNVSPDCRSALSIGEVEGQWGLIYDAAVLRAQKAGNGEDWSVWDGFENKY